MSGKENMKKMIKIEKESQSDVHLSKDKYTNEQKNDRKNYKKKW